MLSNIRLLYKYYKRHNRQALHRSTCVTWCFYLRTEGFYWSKLLLPHATDNSAFRLAITCILIKNVIYTASSLYCKIVSTKKWTKRCIIWLLPSAIIIRV